jgi:acyl carrier protein
MKTEAILAKILEDVIGAKNVDRDTRFLDIGGNSLNLVQVLKQIKEKTGVSPAPRLFFDKTNSTVAAISAAIDAQRATASAAD